MFRRSSFVAVICASAICAALAFVLLRPSEPRVVRVGDASYVVGSTAAGPPRPVRTTLKAPLPTHRFWSSLIAGATPQAHYPHPLAVHASDRGFRVGAPSIGVDPHKSYSSVLDPSGGEDLTLLAHRMQAADDIALEEHGDWSVRVRLADEHASMHVTYAHGSPYVMVESPGLRVTFPEPPQVWLHEGATLGLTVHGRDYGLFAAKGSAWSAKFENATTTHVAVALLPSREALPLFAKHAHVLITGTHASFDYDQKIVRTHFELSTKTLEGDEREPLIALYPHQWAHTQHALLPHAYTTVRGQMRLMRGASFSTELTFPGLLPSLPPLAAVEPSPDDELERGVARDTYFEGKVLGRLAAQVPLVKGEEQQRLVSAIGQRLEQRFTATHANGEIKDHRFDYDKTWGTLIGRPAAFGNDVDLNDHHLQYGYFLRAAAVVAEHDPGWDKRYGGFIDLLVRDVASNDRADPLFPHLRVFDVYAGHSWASGFAPFPAGNNLESSSEAMNAWSALILLGEARGDSKLVALGAFLYATELSAIEAYWFDVERRNFPEKLDSAAMAMIWGGKAGLETWFSADPEALFGINWLPLHGGSLYLGRYPDHAQRVYDQLRSLRGSERWQRWGDLVIMYRALSDAQDALRQLPSAPAVLEEGNSRLNLQHWVRSLTQLGHVDRTLSADAPLAVAFDRAYVIYCMRPRTVTFSNGQAVTCSAPGFARVDKP